MHRSRPPLVEDDLVNQKVALACTAESDSADSLIGSIESGFERVHRRLTARLCEGAA